MGALLYVEGGVIKAKHSDGHIDTLSSQTRRERLTVTRASSATTGATTVWAGFSVASGKTYRFQAVLLYIAAATTTGPRPLIQGPAMADILAVGQNELTATTSEWQHVTAINTQLAFTGARSTASATPGKLVIDGSCTPSADGTLNMGLLSEVAGSAVTLQVGSYWVVEELA